MSLEAKQLIEMLDNMEDGFYILDKDGFYVYGNIAGMGPNRNGRLGTDVHDLLKVGIVDFCISDLVREKQQAITMVQRVTHPGMTPYNQLITSTPIFDADGQIQYFFTELYNLNKLNWKYQQSLLKQPVQRLTFTDKDEGGLQAEPMIAESRAMKDVLEMADRVCNIQVPVLLDGESGTGKEVLARYIYEKSARSKKKLVIINCAALPENLLEAELFGYEKGAFTGALQTGKKGLIEEADGGTLFLDEVNSLPLSLQGKLLRVLETRVVRRLGSTRTQFVDYRLIAATNEDLYECCKQGRFRSDLYYRLNVVPITLPPLRERREDIAPLTALFLQKCCERYSRMKVFSPELLNAFTQYDWPGNVRELKNAVERVVVMSAQDVLTIREIPPSLYSGKRKEDYDRLTRLVPMQGGPKSPADLSADRFDLKGYLANCEKAVLEEALKRFGSTYKAAQYLGMDQSSVARKKIKYHIEY